MTLQSLLRSFPESSLRILDSGCLQIRHLRNGSVTGFIATFFWPREVDASRKSVRHTVKLRGKTCLKATSPNIDYQLESQINDSKKNGSNSIAPDSSVSRTFGV